MKRLALVLIFLFIAPLANVSAGWSDTVQDDHWVTIDSLGNRCGPELPVDQISTEWDKLDFAPPVIINSSTWMIESNSELSPVPSPVTPELLMEISDCHSGFIYRTNHSSDVLIHSMRSSATRIPGENISTSAYNLEAHLEGNRIGWGLILIDESSNDSILYLQMENRVQVLLSETQNGTLQPSLHLSQFGYLYGDTRDIPLSDKNRPCQLNEPPHCLDTDTTVAGVQPSHELGNLSYPLEIPNTPLRETRELRIHLVDIGGGQNLPVNTANEFSRVVAGSAPLLENLASVTPVITRYTDFPTLLASNTTNHSMAVDVSQYRFNCNEILSDSNSSLNQLSLLLNNRVGNVSRSIDSMSTGVDLVWFASHEMDLHRRLLGCGLNYGEGLNSTVSRLVNSNSLGRVVITNESYPLLSGPSILLQSMTFAHEVFHALGLRGHDNQLMSGEEINLQYNCSIEYNGTRHVLRPALSLMAPNRFPLECHNPIYLRDSEYDRIWNGTSKSSIHTLMYNRSSLRLNHTAHQWIAGGWKLDSISVSRQWWYPIATKIAYLEVDVSLSSHNENLHQIGEIDNSLLSIQLSYGNDSYIYELVAQLDAECIQLELSYCPIVGWATYDRVVEEDSLISSTLSGVLDCETIPSVGTCILELSITHKYNNEIDSMLSPLQLSFIDGDRRFHEYANVSLSVSGHTAMNQFTGEYLLNPNAQSPLNNGVRAWLVITL